MSTLVLPSAAASVPRDLEMTAVPLDQLPDGFRVTPGQLMMATIGSGRYSQFETADGTVEPIDPGSSYYVVAGARYGHISYVSEMEVPQDLSGPWHLLADSGVAGRVKQINRGMPPPNDLVLRAVMFDGQGRGVRTRDYRKIGDDSHSNSVPSLTAVFFGTGMSVGKSTAAAVLGAAASHVEVDAQRLYEVRASKVTGMAGSRDQVIMTRAGAVAATDFVDLGYPSTYGATESELVELFFTLRSARPRNLPPLEGRELWIAEFGGDVLHREVDISISHAEIREATDFFVFCSDTSYAALWGLQALYNRGIFPAAISGIIASSPSMLDEVQRQLPDIAKNYMDQWREHHGRDEPTLPSYDASDLVYENDLDGERYLDPAARFVVEPSEIDGSQVLAAVGLPAV